MRRRGGDDSSLELLLDTICNTFGGVLFLAMLVALLISQTRKRTEIESADANPAPAVTPAEFVRLQTEAEQAIHELEQLKMAEEGMESVANNVVEPGYAEKVAERREARQDVEELLEEKYEVLREISRAQAAAARAKSRIIDIIENEDKVEQEFAEAKAELDAAVEERNSLVQTALKLQQREPVVATVQTTGKAPRERSTDKIEFGLLMKYGRLYKMHNYRGYERYVNSDDFVVQEGFAENVAMPKPHAGFEVANPGLTQYLREAVRGHPSSAWYPSVVVFPDSFAEFLAVKNSLVELGYEYRLIPSQEGVYDGGGEGGRVQ